MVHSEKLEETVLWRVYQGKVSPNEKRSSWVKEVYEAAATYMMDVRQTFQNYTLHDETHILNVLDAMGGLLGDRIDQLTVGEIELLVLAACLHDLGMVYTEDEKQRCFQDEEACRKFLREYCPELLGCPAEEWTEDIQRWYLRTLHPFRLPGVLQNKTWKELFDRCPLEVVPKRCMIAVCQAHGENPAELLHNKDLDYLSANNADPLFCALLLRLGDLLDFDDTRAPRILYSYVACNDKSRAEWDKHQASAGFRYPASPFMGDLPYKARCTNPGVEHAVRDFLDWIDEELTSCMKLQKHCRTGWQQEFPFPRAVLRDEIESEGYMSGDFCLTMDQAQILKLLTGENLYDDTDVFIRELLQNAIDATLLRAEMQPDFIPEKARIDLWEWNDKEGNIWFRIDDQGTGMTLGMLQRYFLKVGNSHYNSREIERDLREHGRTKKYHGISCFGIGFLSCFLCGNYAEVSTLYFDTDKNRREEAVYESYQTIHYGLRLQVTGLNGYYTLKNQAKHHQADEPLPAPSSYGAGVLGNVERDGYRAKPGTSIAIRFEAGMLGALNLHDAIEKYLCGSRVPVYYNNERIGLTYEEIMRAAHEEEGEKIYEMTPKMKEEFDRSFPAICGKYPKLAVSVITLDKEENQALPELSGFLVKYDVHFDEVPQWKVKDQTYKVYGLFGKSRGIIEIVFACRNKKDNQVWKGLMGKYDIEKVAALEAEFEKYSSCPKAEDMMEIWEPFAEQMELYEAWRSYNDKKQEKELTFSVAEFKCPDIVARYQHRSIAYVYQGVVTGDLNKYHQYNENDFAVFLMGSAWKPIVNVSRSRISELPLYALLAINSIMIKYRILDDIGHIWFDLGGWKDRPLKEWRVMKNSHLDRWIWKNLADFFIEAKQILQQKLQSDKFEFFILSYENYIIVYKYLMAYFQDKYRMTICYENEQAISFEEKKDNEMEDTYDLFPPMMFCMAASDWSRQYICGAKPFMRRGITADHPFATWLLDNAAKLNKYYPRQFQQIVNCLCENTAEDIVEKCNYIREQMLRFPENHGVDVSAFPQLSLTDFWLMKEE